MSDNREAVRWEDTAEIVELLIQQHEQIEGLRGGQVILVGGSAMLAHSVRISSGDVDLYSPDMDPDVVLDVENKLQEKFGADFRIDLTSTENLWGNLLIRDLAVRSPLLKRVETPTACWDVKALDVETLFLVKLDAGRKKDMEDIVAISHKTNAEKLITRFNEMVKWHGLPDTIMGYADRFIEKIHELYGTAPTTTIKQISPALSRHVTSMLKESWCNDGLADEPALPPSGEQSSGYIANLKSNSSQDKWYSLKLYANAERDLRASLQVKENNKVLFHQSNLKVKDGKDGGLVVHGDGFDAKIDQKGKVHFFEGKEPVRGPFHPSLKAPKGTDVNDSSIKDLRKILDDRIHRRDPPYID
jgi:hypothetical protein